MSYTIGVDYGTNSVRAIVVRASDGVELGTGIFSYPSGHQGILLDSKDHNLARQHPGDYLEGLESSVAAALTEAANADANFTRDQVVAIGVDSTGSSPIPVDATNTPLALDPKFKDHLAAQCWLWKDHTAIAEAEEITRCAQNHRPQYLAKIGGIYSSEWFWAKIWKCLKVDPAVFEAAHSWVELCDFIPATLAAVTDPTLIVRSVCAAGHKALYAPDWGGLPDKEFLSLLDPKLAALRDRLYEEAHDASKTAGHLSPDWARKWGIPVGHPHRSRAIRRPLRSHWLRSGGRHSGQSDRNFHLRLRRRFRTKRSSRYSWNLRNRERLHPSRLLRPRGRTVSCR